MEEWCIYIFAAGSFHTKKICSWLFFRQNLNLLDKIAKSRFMPPFRGDRGNVHDSSMARWKARGRLPISANWTVFASCHAVEALWANIGRNCAVWKGVGHFQRKFQGEERGSSTNAFWRQRTRVPGLSRGVVCVILRLAVLILYRRVTHRRTHDDGYYPRLACTARVKILILSHPLGT